MHSHIVFLAESYRNNIYNNKDFFFFQKVFFYGKELNFRWMLNSKTSIVTCELQTPPPGSASMTANTS